MGRKAKYEVDEIALELLHQNGVTDAVVKTGATPRKSDQSRSPTDELQRRARPIRLVISIPIE